ncbi:hypothetical protein ON010_g3281 [Phytophthora cinnamomi]|nr:hypothetical protein ON010_g3281 [Phytophthora cinnamomi]
MRGDYDNDQLVHDIVNPLLVAERTSRGQQLRDTPEGVPWAGVNEIHTTTGDVLRHIYGGSQQPVSQDTQTERSRVVIEETESVQVNVQHPQRDVNSYSTVYTQHELAALSHAAVASGVVTTSSRIAILHSAKRPRSSPQPGATSLPLGPRPDARVPDHSAELH